MTTTLKRGDLVRLWSPRGWTTYVVDDEIRVSTHPRAHHPGRLYTHGRRVSGPDALYRSFYIDEAVLVASETPHQLGLWGDT